MDLKLMELSQAQEKFILKWGKLCTNWGVNRAMGQIHALLLITKDDLCADEIMEELTMSRGSVNMNLKSLESWSLIEKVHKSGERKDFYRAEKDMSKVFKIIVTQRKKRELDPLLCLMDEIESVAPECPESSEFCRMTKEIERFAKKADHALTAITSSKADWISKFFIR